MILVIILVIYYKGKSAGKKYAPDPVTLPSDTQGNNVPANWNPGTITDALEQDVYGYGLHNIAPYRDALKLSNSQLVAVHNDWNQRKYSKHQETLRQAIAVEFYTQGTVRGAARTLEDRLETLGL